MREKVLRYIRERKLMRAGDRVAVAVSGGADSVALLRVLLELRNELGIVVSVAHFNHGLRGEASEGDEAFVAELARQHELEFFCGRGDVREHALTSKLGLEAAARELRYRWLSSLAAAHNLNQVATGHTLDDQAETVLLKFLRGAGTRGLAGVYPEIAIGSKQINETRSVSSAEADSYARTVSLDAGLKARTTQPSPLPASSCSTHSVERGAKARNHPTEPYGTPKGVPLQISIIRPLLKVTREEVEQYLAAIGQTWREDESNLDQRFTRNRVRHELLPLLERGYNPNLRQVLSDAAELARAEEEYWQALVEQELAARQHSQTEIPSGLKPSTGVAGDGTAKAVPFQSTAVERFPGAAGQLLSLANFQALPLALQRRLLRRFVETANLTLDFEHVEKLLRCALGESPKAELPGGWLAARTGECLQLRAPQLTHSSPDYVYILPAPGEVHITEIGLTVRCIRVPREFAKEEAPESLLGLDLLGPELTVRNWRPGDRFLPVHSKSEEKLKRLFSEKHIPEKDRHSWPLVLCGSQVVWVQGFPVARAFAWDGTGDALKIEILE